MIKIGDKWIVDADTMCYTLKRKSKREKGKHKGEDCLIVEGFFSSPQEALLRIYDIEVREKITNNDYDLKSIIGEMYAIREMLKRDIAEVING